MQATARDVIHAEWRIFKRGVVYRQRRGEDPRFDLRARHPEGTQRVSKVTA
jgi:hypothetical protein